MSDIPEKYLAGKEKVVLSDAERGAMRSSLVDYLAKNPAVAKAMARFAESRRAGKPVSTYSSYHALLQNLIYTNYMPIAILLVILLGGGTSFAAERANPGDALYSVKTGVNENVRGMFTVGAEAEANWEARLAERRLEEANNLEAEGRLDADVEQDISVEVEKHADKSQKEIAKLEADGKAEAASSARVRLSQALTVHEDIASGEKGDNATSSALQVRQKEGAITNVINRIEVKLSEPVKVETNNSGSVDGDASPNSGNAGQSGTLDDGSDVRSETEVKPETDAKSDDSGASSGATVNLETSGAIKLNR
ncbi:MAG TPA: DUF5667 domain-containing protein [Candidatus Paceibacterota bacterium]